MSVSSLLALLSPLSIVMMGFVGVAALAPPATAECNVSLNDCTGTCDVNLGSCHDACTGNLNSRGSPGACTANLGASNYGGCTINFSYCGASCVVSSGPVGLNVLTNGGCQTDYAVNAGNVCGGRCPPGAAADIAIVPYGAAPANATLCVPPDRPAWRTSARSASASASDPTLPPRARGRAPARPRPPATAARGTPLSRCDRRRAASSREPGRSEARTRGPAPRST